MSDQPPQPQTYYSSNQLRSEQLAPHSVEAEEAVLGSILISPDAILEIAGVVDAGDFFIVRHSWIYAAMLSIHERRDPIDYLTVVNELEQAGKIAEIGGAAYILSLINRTPSALNVEGYARIVKRMSVRRKLIDAAGGIARVAHSEETDIDAVIAQCEKHLFDATRGSTEDRTRSTFLLAGQLYDLTVAKQRGQIVELGVKTYQRALDAIMHSMRKGDLIVIAGRPGMGKSSWLDSVIVENARRGIRGGLISLEMSAEQITIRLLSAESGLTYQQILDGDIPDGQATNFLNATNRVQEWRIPIDDSPTLNPSQLRTIARRMVHDDGIEFLCVDYIQLMNGGGNFSNGDENRAAEVAYITRQLKLLARELDIPVIAAAQLSRKVEERRDKRPLLSDLKESGAIEQDADVVIFLYRDAYYNPPQPGMPSDDTTEIHIAKNRHGPTGVVFMVFLARQMLFVDKLMGSASPPPTYDDDHVYRGDTIDLNDL